MSVFRKVFRIIVNTLSVVLLLVGILAFVLILTSGRQGLPSIFGYSFLTVSSTSMEPDYMKGDMLLIEKTDADEIKVGDDICFFSSDPKIKGIPNTHRIEKIKTDETGKRYFVTKGVANIKADDYPVYDNQLVGRVIKSSAFLGKVFRIISTQEFMFFALIIPLVAIIFTEVLNIRKIADDRKDSSGKEDKAD